MCAGSACQEWSRGPGGVGLAHEEWDGGAVSLALGADVLGILLQSLRRTQNSEGSLYFLR